MNDENSDLAVAHASSGAEEPARKILWARLVLAFNTVPSEVLFGAHDAKRKGGRPSLVYCGDDRSANDLTAALIRDVGIDPVDAGLLGSRDTSSHSRCSSASSGTREKRASNWPIGCIGMGNRKAPSRMPCCA